MKKYQPDLDEIDLEPGKHFVKTRNGDVHICLHYMEKVHQCEKVHKGKTLSSMGKQGNKPPYLKNEKVQEGRMGDGYDVVEVKQIHPTYFGCGYGHEKHKTIWKEEDAIPCDRYVTEIKHGDMLRYWDTNEKVWKNGVAQEIKPEDGEGMQVLRAEGPPLIIDVEFRQFVEVVPISKLKW